MTPIFKRSPMASDPMAHSLIWQTESLSPLYEHILKFRKIPSGNVTPLNRKHASGWHEIIVPSSDVTEGKFCCFFLFIENICRFFTNWKLIFNYTNLVCRTTTLNGIHDKRVRAGQCLRSCCHRTQSIRFEQFKCSRPICHIWRKQVIANDAMILMSSLNWLVYFSVELPNYSTESTDEESYEQSYYDDSSSSAMDPQSTIDGTSYDSYPFDPYNRSSSTNSEKYILLFTIFGLFLFNWQ